MELTVAAAMIVDGTGAVLCVRRGAKGFPSTANKWEFPGGKLEPGETPAQTAVREVREELGLEVEALAETPPVRHVYPEFAITLHGVLCAPLGGGSPTPALREHAAFAWTLPDQLWRHDFAAADTALLCGLRERFFGARLRAATFGRHARFLPESASTNTDALALAERGAPEGTLVVAERQTAGRGRLGRAWEAAPGQCLTCSLLARPKAPPEVAATLPLVAGLAVAGALRARGFEAGLKWPNDVLIGERKVCGILCEAQTSARGIEGIVVGIGVNTGAVPEALAHRAVGLGGVDRLALLAELCGAFEALYARWATGGLPALRAELDALDCKRGKPIRVRPAGVELEGLALGIRDDGALLLRRGGAVEPILCGEIAQWD